MHVQNFDANRLCKKKPVGLDFGFSFLRKATQHCERENHASTRRTIFFWIVTRRGPPSLSVISTQHHDWRLVSFRILFFSVARQIRCRWHANDIVYEYPHHTQPNNNDTATTDESGDERRTRTKRSQPTNNCAKGPVRACVPAKDALPGSIRSHPYRIDYET